MIMTNPDCVKIDNNNNLDLLGYFLHSMAQWNEPTPELQQLFKQILHGYKQKEGENWLFFYNQKVPPQIRNHLSALYGV